jgi:hypothetical protein
MSKHPVKRICCHACAIGALISACMTWPDVATAQEFSAYPSGPSLPEILSKIRGLRSQGQIPTNAPTTIILHNGTYPLSEPLQLQAAESGTEASPLIVEAAPGEHPVLSGGVQISGWSKSDKEIRGLPSIARGNVWVADAPKINGTVLNFRQLWINDKRAVWAREPNGKNMERLTGWDKTNQIALVPAAALRGIKQPGQLEMVIDQVWEIAVLRMNSINIKGTDALVTFREPEGKIEFTHPWPPVIVNTNYHAPFFLENAIQFLDSPGEWFEDLSMGKVYYWPREGEDMTQATVIAPALETLVQIDGSPDSPASNIEFQGIRFAHTTWLRPSEQGHVPLQVGMFMLDAHRLVPKGTPYQPKLDNVAWIGRPPAAVSVRDGNHISFVNCTFEGTGSAGLDLNRTHDDLVQGCTFRDIGGNGIQLGDFSETNMETHVPWNPINDREVCSNEMIVDNVIMDCGRDDPGCCGIAAGYVRDAKIEHNDVSALPYTGISIGWGWTKLMNATRDNLIFANRVHYVGQLLGDLGGIYTLSAQPGTVVAENAIDNIEPSRYVPDPDHWYYLYLDEGSSFITVRDNWCPAEKFLRNANGPGNVWTNNGPQVSEAIKNAAGLEPAYRSLLSEPSP